MATKKKTSSDERKVVQWFSRTLKNRAANKGLTLDQKKKKARQDVKQMLFSTNGDAWKIREPLEFKKVSGNRFKLTVFVIQKKRAPGEPPPGDAPVSSPKSPPPDM